MRRYLKGGGDLRVLQECPEFCPQTGICRGVRGSLEPVESVWMVTRVIYGREAALLRNN